MPRASWAFIANLQIAYPTIEEQTAIANYLDRKTVEIDTLIAQKERLIALYEEEKAAIINQAVTKGIDSAVGVPLVGTLEQGNHKGLPLRDSGIDWLGEIPAGWKVKKLKYLSLILRGKFAHRPRNDERLYGGIYPFIQTGEVTNANKFIKGYRQTLNEAGYAVSQEFPSGTLVMTIAANIGDVAILSFDACFPDSIVGFYPKNEVIVDFLYYKLISIRSNLIGCATQNTQQNLNIDRISPIEISFPNNKTVQTAIVHHIETETTRIDAKIAKTQRIIELQKEYRTALISEVVTGKIKVPS
ncbi:restriction endonuclease subunit S [Methylomonas sp. LL1]|nr:restriction endonuclease subunit S [Methylomonas sp. LL1]